jgi:rhamnulokinase
MSTGNYLAFDLGASSGRAMLGTLRDGRLELAEIHRFPNGAKEIDGALFWDFEALWGEIKVGLRKAAEQVPDLAGIGVDTWGVDYALLRADGSFARLPYMYRDQRNIGVDQKVHRHVSPEELYRRTGLQFMPFNTIFQLFAHREQHPEDLVGTTLLMMPDAIIHRLSGAAACEYTDASTTGLLDARARSWDVELIDRVGLPRGIFPPLARPCARAGTLRPEVQQEVGCGPVPVWHVGGHDTASAVASVPADMSRPWAYISCGTWALLGTELAEPTLTEAARQASYTNEGGLDRTIRFLTNITGLWLLQECRRVWQEGGLDWSYAEMADMACRAPAFCYLINPNDPVFSTPGDMPARIEQACREAGTGQPPDAAALIRCVLDSLALSFKVKLEELAGLTGARYDFLHIVGGGCQNRLLMQLTADVIGLPVVAGPAEATAIGNILAQAIGAGQVGSLPDARELVRRSFDVETYRSSPDRDLAAIAAAIARFRVLLGKAKVA